MVASALATMGVTALISQASSPSGTFDPSRQYPYDYSYVSQGVDGTVTNRVDLSSGSTATLYLDLQNTGTEAWQSGGEAPFRLGTARPRDRISTVRDSSWIGGNRPATFSGKVVSGKGGTTTEPATTIQPGETARFSFTITAPNTAAQFREYVRPVLERRFWLGRDFGIYWNVTIGDRYESQWVDQTYATPTATSQQGTVSLALKNTGNVSWKQADPPLRLGTSRPLDRASNLHDDSWPSTNRVGTFVGKAVLDSEGNTTRDGEGLIAYETASTIAPGEIAVFRFTAKAPVTPLADAKEYFRPVVEGVTWLRDWGVYWPVTTTEATPSPTPTPTPTPTPAPTPTPTPTPTDTTSPTVSLSTPADGATVSGTVSVSATASDNVGVAGVQFKVDGTNLGSEDTASPYSVSWDTTTVTNGSYTLTAVARDAAGNMTTSGSRTVTVDNGTSSADLFVTTTGSDANPCTQAQPCVSLNRAYQVASPGDTIEVAAGSYGSQTIAKDTGKALGSTKVTIRAVGTVNFTGFTTYANDVHYIGLRVPNSQATIRAGRNVVLENFRAEKPYIWGPTSSTSSGDTIENVTIKGGDFGPHVSCGGGFQVTRDGPPRNVTVDGASFHDFSIDESCPTAHLDCMHTFNGIDGLTVRNSRFYRCEHFGMLVNGASNVLIENNFLEGGIYGFKLRGDNDPSIEVFNNVTIRHNSADHIALGSNGSNTLSNVLIEGNAAIDGVNCRTGVTYRGNMYGCSNDDFPAPPGGFGFADPDNGDFSITSGSPLVDKLTSGPLLDIDGDSRPQGSGYDIGADEVTDTSSSWLEQAIAQANQVGSVPWYVYVPGLTLLVLVLLRSATLFRRRNR